MDEEKSPAEIVQDRVETVIGDLAAGRVWAKSVDALGKAVEGAKRDAAVRRAGR